ncbi:hypothetical protein [Streptomyces niveus]|uniref:hypothetical protein n=1 Tax=Streptomyces niveus TaxID=193462 RepID=UPI0034133051
MTTDSDGRRTPIEDGTTDQPDIAAMLRGQTSACEAARAAIADGGEVMLYHGRPPQWMVLGITSTRLKRSLKTGLVTLGLDETVEILRTRHPDEQLRLGSIVAPDRSWFFTVYFDATGTELLACSGVKNERPSRAHGQKLQL